MTVTDQPLDLVEVADELGRVKAYYECAYLAVSDACNELADANAIQSVMLGAEEKLKKVIDNLAAEVRRQKQAA